MNRDLHTLFIKLEAGMSEALYVTLPRYAKDSFRLLSEGLEAKGTDVLPVEQEEHAQTIGRLIAPGQSITGEQRFVDLTNDEKIELGNALTALFAYLAKTYGYTYGD